MSTLLKSRQPIGSKKFLVLALEMKYFLEWTIEVDGLAAKSIYESTKTKANTLSRPLEEIMFARNTSPNLKESKTEQVQQVIKALLFVENDVYKDKQVSKFSCGILENNIEKACSFMEVSICCQKCSRLRDDRAVCGWWLSYPHLKS